MTTVCKKLILSDTISEILGSKLPSKNGVLQLLLHHIASMHHLTWNRSFLLPLDESVSEQLSVSASASGTVQDTSDTSASLASSISLTTSDPDFYISQYDRRTVPIPPVTFNKMFITKR